MELKDMTFLEVLQLNIFEQELKKQIAMEIALYDEVSAKGKLKRMAMDCLRERDMFNAKAMTEAYYHIMHKEAQGYSANERKYIQDVCAMAYQRTIKRLQAESDWNEKHPIRAKFKEWWERFNWWLLEKANRHKKV